MHKAIILHGKPSREKFENAELPPPSQSNWIPWVREKLEARGYETDAPDLPVPYEPNYDAWATEFERYHVGRNTSLVGHSAGGGFLLKWLSYNPGVTPERLILVAPWVDPNKKYFPEFVCHWRSDILGKIGQITVFYSSLDDEQAVKSLDIIRNDILPSNATYYDIPEKGHYLIGNTMPGPEFPEILEEFE